MIKNKVFTQEDRWPVNIFKRLFTGYLESAGLDTSDWSTDAITLWSLIHGLTFMIINNTIAYEGDYMELVSRMLKEKLFTLGV